MKENENVDKFRRYKHLPDGTCWPVINPSEDDNDIEWKFRYRPDSVTKKDLMCAASYIAAYGALITKTQKRRNEICKQLLDKDTNDTNK